MDGPHFTRADFCNFAAYCVKLLLHFSITSPQRPGSSNAHAHRHSFLMLCNSARLTRPEKCSMRNSFIPRPNPATRDHFHFVLSFHCRRKDLTMLLTRPQASRDCLAAFVSPTTFTAQNAFGRHDISSTRPPAVLNSSPHSPAYRTHSTAFRSCSATLRYLPAIHLSELNRAKFPTTWPAGPHLRPAAAAHSTVSRRLLRYAAICSASLQLSAVSCLDMIRDTSMAFWP